jgi:hypothetical protein
MKAVRLHQTSIARTPRLAILDVMHFQLEAPFYSFNCPKDLGQNSSQILHSQNYPLTPPSQSLLYFRSLLPPLSSMHASAIAFQLNEQGLRHLAIQENQDAIRAFARGLQVAKEVISNLSPDCETGLGVQTSPETLVAPMCFYVEVCSIPDSIEHDTRQGESLPEGKCIFSKPIHLVAPSTLHSSSLSSYSTMLSFVLLFNLALAHHITALTARNVSKNKLTKASLLYELSYNILITEQLQELTTPQIMAIINNLGQIHFFLCNFEKADQYFQYLLSLIMCLNDVGDDEAKREIQGFLPNVLSLILKSSSAAAA